MSIKWARRCPSCLDRACTYGCHHYRPMPCPECWKSIGKSDKELWIAGIDLQKDQSFIGLIESLTSNVSIFSKKEVKEMTTLETLYEGLSQDQNDWQLRGILADWYEENNQQDIADCIRWMIKNKKRPYKANNKYCWFNIETRRIDNDLESDINTDIFSNLSKGKVEIEGIYRSYDNLIDAETDFYRAWIFTRPIFFATVTTSQPILANIISSS